MSTNEPSKSEMPSAEEFEKYLGKMQHIVQNALMTRKMLQDSLNSGRIDLNKECNHPDNISPYDYKNAYDRFGIANRVVKLMPNECWQEPPEVYEDDNPAISTDFERAWEELLKSMKWEKSWYGSSNGSPLWEVLKRLDILSGMGNFGVLLLGFNDGRYPWEPVEGVSYTQSNVAFGDTPAQGTDAQYYTGVQMGTPEFPSDKPSTRKLKLTFARPFDQSMVQITQIENSPSSPRYGLPVFYLITLNDPKFDAIQGIGSQSGVTLRVHWTRVIHVADNLDSSEVNGKPRLKPVWNRVLDLMKLYGGSAEMYWRGAFPGLSFETQPQLGGDVEFDKTAFQESMYKFFAGLERYIVTTGMTAKPLSPQVADPTAQIKGQIEHICIYLGCPVRVFMGSERGELASTQDDDNWNKRVDERRTNHVSPHIIIPFIDRMIMAGVLPEPKQYFIKWPELDSIGVTGKLANANTMITALNAYIAGNTNTLIAPMDLLTKVLNFTSIEAEAILEAAAEYNAAIEAEQAEGQSEETHDHDIEEVQDSDSETGGTDGDDGDDGEGVEEGSEEDEEDVESGESGEDGEDESEDEDEEGDDEFEGEQEEQEDEEDAEGEEDQKSDDDDEEQV